METLVFKIVAFNDVSDAQVAVASIVDLGKHIQRFILDLVLLRHIVEDLFRLEADHLLEVFTVFQDIL